MLCSALDMSIMEIRKEKLLSKYDGLELEVELMLPNTAPRGIVQISHGMTEHKERYEEFMGFLCGHGFICVIHDHRGHGKSVKEMDDLGYFYTEDIDAVTGDLHQVTEYIKTLYPGVPIYLFGHSMGSLIARCYLKRYDGELSGLVLCGPPTKNRALPLAIGLTRLSMLLKGPKYRNKLINHLAFNLYNKPYDEENSWLSANGDNVRAYNDDPLCGFTFTNNGFLNLFYLLREAYSKKGWSLGAPGLPILLIAGAEDPVIQSEADFYELSRFLKDRGYGNISSRLYPGMRHEILNEQGRGQVYQDVFDFLKP